MILSPIYDGHRVAVAAGSSGFTRYGSAGGGADNPRRSAGSVSGTCFNAAVEVINTDGRRPARMTIRQVAELAGVSIATVSRVLNGHSDVSSQTREAVQRVIREHGYQPGTRPRPGGTGGTGRTGLIGVTVP